MSRATAPVGNVTMLSQPMTPRIWSGLPMSVPRTIHGVGEPSFIEQPHTADTVAARRMQISGKTVHERMTPKTIAFRNDLSMLAAYAGFAHFQARSGKLARSRRIPHRKRPWKRMISVPAVSLRQARLRFPTADRAWTMSTSLAQVPLRRPSALLLCAKQQRQPYYARPSI